MAQKRRRMSPDRALIQEQVQNLLDAGFICDIIYPAWLSNFVMVSKSNRKCQMCVDYIDLNKACPKDSYPLLSIDGLVDMASGFQFLSFYGCIFRIQSNPNASL